jgi:ferric-chelate reductase
MHDVSMLYMWIMWVVIGGVFLIWIIIRVMAPSKVKTAADKESGAVKSTLSIRDRVYRGVATLRQRYLLTELWPKVFGRVSTLQVTILAVILGYLLAFS